MDKKWFITETQEIHDLNEFRFFFTKRKEEQNVYLTRGNYSVYGYGKNMDNVLFASFYSEEEAKQYIVKLYNTLRSV